MKRSILFASLGAVMLVFCACEKKNSDCEKTYCASCPICDAGQGSDDLIPDQCEDILRPNWECVALLDCTSPRDLNLFANAEFQCPDSLPVCCVRNFYPPPKDIDAGTDGGE